MYSRTLGENANNVQIVIICMYIGIIDAIYALWNVFWITKNDYLFIFSLPSAVDGCSGSSSRCRTERFLNDIATFQ